MSMTDPILAEMSHEMATTRKLLERLPQGQLGWKPHEKSMTLGRLASHIAEIPGWVSEIVDREGFDVGASGYVPPTVATVAEILEMFDRTTRLAAEAVKRQTTERLMATWRLTKKGQLVVEMPRVGVIRTFLLNHLIHHRGQLSVYLRLLNVPLPSIYGPTADEPM
jgi:uncharacterized damage-inducible protein DinB